MRTFLTQLAIKARAGILGAPSVRSEVERLIVYGTHSSSWMRALAPQAPIWQQVFPEQDVPIVHVPHGAIAADLRASSIVLPLMEDHIQYCIDSGVRALLPSRTALDYLRNKAAFAIHNLMHGLSDFCPRVYQTERSAEFPCVLKRTDLNAGVGVAVARSPEHLKELLSREPWRDRPYVLQELVRDADDCVMHAVCCDGRIEWQCVYRYPSNGGEFGARKAPVREALTLSQKAILERFVQPLAYTGPCNIDFKLFPDGRLLVLEVNPRLGGSLMLPPNHADLARTIQHIVKLATRRGARASRMSLLVEESPSLLCA